MLQTHAPQAATPLAAAAVEVAGVLDQEFVAQELRSLAARISNDSPIQDKARARGPCEMRSLRSEAAAGDSHLWHWYTCFSCAGRASAGGGCTASAAEEVAAAADAAAGDEVSRELAEEVGEAAAAVPAGGPVAGAEEEEAPALAWRTKSKACLHQ